MYAGRMLVVESLKENIMTQSGNQEVFPNGFEFKDGLYLYIFVPKLLNLLTILIILCPL